MIISVPKETATGESRVAIVPGSVATLVKEGHEVRVQAGAGVAGGFPDEHFAGKGASIVADRGELIGAGEVIAQVRTAGANPDKGMDDLSALRAGQVVIGLADPLTSPEATKAMAERGVTLLSMELIPRITRAQSMDVLSSQANIAGYKSVIRAAELLKKIFPMQMTAAGTLQPARVFIVGAGVAGLQAIATAKRLGAIVHAIDVRPEVKEQVESLGARFVMPPVQASGEGGYAKELTPEQKAQQQQMMVDTVAESDVVITTALIPGRPAPRLVTADMVLRMKPGSVIVDLAAERGGNCELTQRGKTIDHNGVTIVGDDNLISSAAHHASQMYSNNLVQLLKHLYKKGAKTIDFTDEIAAAITVCRDGQIVHPRVRDAISSVPSPGTPGEG